MGKRKQPAQPQPAPAAEEAAGGPRRAPRQPRAAPPPAQNPPGPAQNAAQNPPGPAQNAAQNPPGPDNRGIAAGAPVEPRNADDLVHNVVVRQLHDDEQQPPPRFMESPVLDAMRSFVDRTRKGDPIEPIKEALFRFNAAHGERSELYAGMFVTHQYDRMQDWLEVQNFLEKFLQRCFRRRDLTPAEALVFLKMCQSEIKAIAEGIKFVMENKGTATSQRSLSTITDRIDNSVTLIEQGIKDRFQGTTPQGREIVRKLIYKARKKKYGGDESSK